MRMLRNIYVLLPKALKTRTIKDTMALVADMYSIGGTKCASAPVVPWAFQSCPAQSAKNEHPSENEELT